MVECRFFDELSTVLDRVATYPDPVYITGDFNIRLDRPEDLRAEQLRRPMLVECHGLELHATGPTHQPGGTLDAVITYDATGRPYCVSVEDVGLSDHYLLRWEVDFTRTVPSTVHIGNRFTSLASA